MLEAAGGMVLRNTQGRWRGYNIDISKLAYQRDPGIADLLVRRDWRCKVSRAGWQKRGQCQKQFGVVRHATLFWTISPTGL